MKISKQRLREIIKEEIQDFKSEQKLRKQIREFTSSATGTGGAKKKGYKSQTRKTAQATSDADSSNYTTKNADYKTKNATYNTARTDYTTKSNLYNTRSTEYTTANNALTAVDSTKYRKANRAAKGGYDYSANPIKGGAVNPTWTTRNNARTAASTAKTVAYNNRASAATSRDRANTAKSDSLAIANTAKAKKAASLATLDTAKASDLQSTIPKVKPPTGGAASFGKGKASTGKGKGKGKGEGKGKKGKDDK